MRQLKVFSERPVIMAEFARPPKSTMSGRNLCLEGDSEDQNIRYDFMFGEETANVLVLPYLYSPKNQGMAAQVESWCRKTGATYGTCGNKKDLLHRDKVNREI